MIANLRGYNNIAKGSGETKQSQIFPERIKVIEIVYESPLPFKVKRCIAVEGNKRGYYH